MSEGSSNEMPKPESQPVIKHTVDSFSQPYSREPGRKGEPVMTRPEPKKAPSRMTRRRLFGFAIGSGTVALIDAVTGGKIRESVGEAYDNIEYNYTHGRGSSVSVEPTQTPEQQKDYPPPINRETVRIQRGDTTINRFDVVNRDEIRLRRDATTAVSSGNDPTPEDNRVDWDDLKSVNGEELGAAKAFKITDAPLVEGQAVDEAGQGYYWIKLENVELKSGEKTTLYVSRSRKTENIVQASGLPQNLNRSADGKINEPNMGRVTVIQPSPVK